MLTEHQWPPLGPSRVPDEHLAVISSGNDPPIGEYGQRSHAIVVITEMYRCNPRIRRLPGQNLTVIPRGYHAAIG